MPKRYIDISNREAPPQKEIDLRNFAEQEKTPPSDISPPAKDVLNLKETKQNTEKPEVTREIPASTSKKVDLSEPKLSSASQAKRKDNITELAKAVPTKEPKDLWEEREEKESSNMAEAITAAEAELGSQKKEITDTKSEEISGKRNKLLIWKSVIAIVIIILMVGVALFGQAFFTGAGIFNQEGTTTLDQIKHLVIPGDKKLLGEDEGRINVLLAGMGGEGHDGALLTDTIIVMSVNPDTEEVAMLSLPRDMWVESDYGYSRINKINYLAEQEEPGTGMEALTETAEKITGLDIPYYVSIDFEGFKEIVDSIGGVSIDVENGFIDKEYPGPNYGYLTIDFERGLQDMDGETALQYARSRHGVITDPDPESNVTAEGSDFARSRRQQKLIAAIKDKAMSTGVIANPAKLNSLFQALDKRIQTNAQLWEGLRLFELAQNVDVSNVKVSVISNDEFLKVYITPDGAYTLIPVDGFGEYGKIQEFAVNIFDRAEDLHGEEIEVPEGEAPEEERPGNEEDEPKTNEEPEKTATVAVQNGTRITGLGAKTATELRNEGLEVTNVGNAADQTRQYTVIYDNTNGQKPDQLQQIADKYEADIITEEAPLNKNGGKEEADFVIILGQESAGYTQI